MNKLSLIIFIIILLNLLIITAQDPSINITLNKPQFIQQEQLSGDINLNINNQIEDKDVEVSFGPYSNIIKFSQLLTKLGKAYEKSPGQKQLTSLQPPEDSIIFPPLVQELGILAPKDAKDFSPSGDIGGWETQGSVPKFPYLDIAEDKYVEWYYLGDQIGWNYNVNSDDLNPLSGYVGLDDENAIVCQRISITSKAKAINVSVNFKDISPGVKVKAKLLTVPTNQKHSYGTSNCELIPNQDVSNHWSSCIINFNEIPRVRQGDYLVCAYPELQASYTETTNSLFSIAKDSKQTTRSYFCIHKTTEGYFECNQNNNYNYLILASIPIYNGTLDKSTTPFSEGATEVSLNDSFMSYLSSNNCPNTEQNCIIPIEVGSLTPGRLYFNGFSIKIKRLGISEDTPLQKLISLPDIITKIDSKSLDSNTMTITIPIKTMYNITTPQVTDSQIIPLTVKYGSSISIYPVQIYQSVLSNQQDVNQTINTVLSALDSYTDQDTKDLFAKLNINLDSLKTTFLSYQSKLNAIEANTTKQQTEKDNEKLALISDIETSKKSIPRYVFTGDKAFNIPAIPPQPSDIKSSILDDKDSDNAKEYVLGLQSSISVTSSAKFVSIKTYSNQSYDYTIVKRIVANSPNDAFIVDIIPKSIAQSSTNLILDQSTTVLESDPIIKKQLTSGSGTLSYMIPGNVINQITDINTLVVSLANAPSGNNQNLPSYTQRCGDGICSKPLEDEITCPEDCKPTKHWTIIIVLLIILVIGIFYINFYKGPGSLYRRIKEKLFHAESDKVNLINYIKKASKYKTKQQIINTLLSKGWTQQQIDTALKEVQKK